MPSIRDSQDILNMADIYTVSQLYDTSDLESAPASSWLYLPSASINSRVGLIQDDITKLELDAIVNAANNSLLGGGGVDGAIHRAAGPGLLDECRGLGGCPTGQAVITRGYDLPAKHVIHTVGPVYRHREPRESEEALRNCYENSLKLASREGVKTLAFSGISTGVYGYPIQSAAEVACDTVRRFLESNDSTLDMIVFVTFAQKDKAAYNKVIPKYFPPQEDSAASIL